MSLKYKPNYCNQCGMKLMENSFYCHNCGNKISIDTPNTCTPQVQIEHSTDNVKSLKSNRKAILFVVICVLILLLSFDFLKALFFYDVSAEGSKNISIYAGESSTIKFDYNTANVFKENISWESSNDSIITVSPYTSGGSSTSRCFISAIRNGTATVHLKINGITKESWKITVSNKIVPVSNGEIIKYPSDFGSPEITIHAPSDNCYVYLENIKAKSNSIAFYVCSNSSATVNIAPGTYKLYYATGDTWYGPDIKFGDKTYYYKSDDTFTFNEDRYGYDIWEVTLYQVANGNMDTDRISEKDFPI